MPLYAVPTVDPAALQAQQINAQLQAARDAANAAVAKRDAANQAAFDARKKQCDDTREERAKHDKLEAAQRLSGETRILTASKAIRAACRLGTKRTGAVNVQRSGDGWRVSPELSDDLQCAKLPPGISKDDAYIVMWRVRETGSIAPSGPVLEADDLDPRDASCAELDRFVGLDPRSATFEDSDSIKRLANWKPITPPPAE